MSRTEYRVVHKVPGVTPPALTTSKESAEDYTRIAGKYLPISAGMKIQYHTITEWKDVSCTQIST